MEIACDYPQQDEHPLFPVNLFPFTQVCSYCSALEKAVSQRAGNHGRYTNVLAVEKSMCSFSPGERSAAIVFMLCTTLFFSLWFSAVVNGKKTPTPAVKSRHTKALAASSAAPGGVFRCGGATPRDASRLGCTSPRFAADRRTETAGTAPPGGRRGRSGRSPRSPQPPRRGRWASVLTKMKWNGP